MSERMITANGIDIWTESFGDRSGVPLLLIMGATAQGIYWPEELIGRFVNRGRFVIRFDNRDTGQSTCFDFAKHPYTLDDLALDAVGVLDAYDLCAAHVAGASMGGMVVQLLMLHHRTRISTATIIMSSPLAGSGELGLPVAPDLEGPDPAFMAKAAAIESQAAESRAAKTKKRSEAFALLSGSVEPFDPGRQLLLAEREFDRANNYDAKENHALAVAASQPTDRRPLLGESDVPALVIHGTEDPILPYPHGVALAETIPGAELLTLHGTGHEMPMCVMDEMADRMVALQDRCV